MLLFTHLALHSFFLHYLVLVLSFIPQSPTYLSPVVWFYGSSKVIIFCSSRCYPAYLQSMFLLQSQFYLQLNQSFSFSLRHLQAFILFLLYARTIKKNEITLEIACNDRIESTVPCEFFVIQKTLTLSKDINLFFCF